MFSPIRLGFSANIVCNDVGSKFLVQCRHEYTHGKCQNDSKLIRLCCLNVFLDADLVDNSASIANVVQSSSSINCYNLFAHIMHLLKMGIEKSCGEHDISFGISPASPWRKWVLNKKSTKFVLLHILTEDSFQYPIWWNTTTLCCWIKSTLHRKLFRNSTWWVFDIFINTTYTIHYSSCWKPEWQKATWMKLA